MPRLSLEEVTQYTAECVESAVLLTEEEAVFVQALSIQLAATGTCSHAQAGSLHTIYHALKARAYG